MHISRETLARIASEEPELAARLLLQGLPTAARELDPALACEITLDGVATQRVGTGSPAPAFHLSTDAHGLLALWRGESPMRLLLRGRVRVRGRRRHVGRLAGLELVQGIEAELGPEIGLLPWVVEPRWTAGHSFRVSVDGRHVVEARDGQTLRVTADASEAESRVDAGFAWVGGALIPAVMLRRWVERAQGGDADEKAREERQRLIQASRADVNCPLRALRARGEREGWCADDVDLSVDRSHWILLPADAQARIRAALAPVAAATERTAAGIAALGPAAPTGEHELLMAAQSADLARQIALIDRVCAEVLALEGATLRDRMRELRADDGDARALAQRIATVPEGLDPFVDGVAAWHVGSGRWAADSRRALRERLEAWAVLPGLAAGLALADRDGVRHLEFAGHVLDETFRRRPADRDTVERRLIEVAVPG